LISNEFLLTKLDKQYANGKRLNTKHLTHTLSMSIEKQQLICLLSCRIYFRISTCFNTILKSETKQNKHL